MYFFVIEELVQNCRIGAKILNQYEIPNWREINVKPKISAKLMPNQEFVRN